LVALAARDRLMKFASRPRRAADGNAAAAAVREARGQMAQAGVKTY
jgi:hypothetical protein